LISVSEFCDLGNGRYLKFLFSLAAITSSLETFKTSTISLSAANLYGTIKTV